MTIKDVMKRFVKGTGGTTELKSTTNLYDEINLTMGKSINPLMALSIDADIAADTDLLGKTVDELQSGIYVYKDSVEGTLYFVDDYTDFSGDPVMQSGHYLVLHAEVPNVQGVTIKTHSSNGRTATLDSDGILITWVSNKHMSMTFTAEKDGEESYSRTIEFGGLFLSKKKAPSDD